MTDLLSRPILRVPSTEPGPDRPVVLVAALGAGVVAVIGLLVCAVVSAAGWFAADTGSFAQGMSVAALAWLVSNGAGLTGGGIVVSAVPLGFLLVCGYALYRTGRWAGATAAVRSLTDVGVSALAMAGTYGAVGVLTALLTDAQGVHAPLVRTAVAYVLVAGGFGGLGLLHGSKRGAALPARLPEEARAALVGGFAGLLVMIALGALVVSASLVVHVSLALKLAEGLRSGIVGGIILALIGAALVPNAVLCAGAFVAGPGFAVGTGTSVSPGGVHLGLLPDFPLLAALPTSADSRWLPGLILFPVVAGGVAGTVAARRYPVFGVDRAALRGVLAGLLGGVSFGLLTIAATGAVGPGRLHHVGPDVLGTTLVCAIAFMLGGAIAAVGGRLFAGALSGALGGARRRTSSIGRSWLSRRATLSVDDPAETSAGISADEELTQPVTRINDAD